MSPEENGKLRSLVAGPLWAPLMKRMGEVVTEKLRFSLTADTEEEAIQTLRDARAAQKFYHSFTTAVETDAQGE